jgi:parallel beta-helix repeat protein
MTRRSQRFVRIQIMTRRSLGFLVLSLLLALPTLAQVGDLSVSFTSETSVTDPFYVWGVRLQWTGAQPARDVVLDIDVEGTFSVVRSQGGMSCTQTNPVRCTMPLLTRGEAFAGATVAVRLDRPGTHHATATVSTSTPEGPVENNTARHAVVQAGLPEIWGSLIAEDVTMDPGGEGTFRLGVTNDGAPATNVILRAKIEDGGEILRAVPTDWSFGPPTAECAIAGGEVTCRIPAMARKTFELVRLHYRAPDRREGGKVVASATVESDQGDFRPENNAFRAELPLRRLIAVESAEDEGSGTLRQAILDANASCGQTPCTIGFRGVSVVQPRTPLPHLRGMVRVSGGDAERVVLDGSLLSEGNGLQFDGGCMLEVYNLEIRNFPGHGIEAGQDTDFNQCYNAGGYGLYVRKSWLVHNERGIVAKGIDVSLKENVILDHRRAGIFIDGSYYSEIFNNVVVNNGATGIFVNTSNAPQFGGIPPGADIVENIVHGNGEWGIARTRTIGLVQMRRNSMIRNGLSGWDIGLDLVSPDRENDASGTPNKPRITDATYDPVTDTTTIRGTSWWGASVDLYASSSLSRHGHPEAETWLGTTHVFQDQKIELKVPGDLRGQWITGTITRSQTLYFLRDEGKRGSEVFRPSSGADTSELSDPVQVR